MCVDSASKLVSTSANTASDHPRPWPLHPRSLPTNICPLAGRFLPHLCLDLCRLQHRCGGGFNRNRDTDGPPSRHNRHHSRNNVVCSGGFPSLGFLSEPSGTVCFLLLLWFHCWRLVKRMARDNQAHPAKGTTCGHRSIARLPIRRQRNWKCCQRPYKWSSARIRSSWLGIRESLWPSNYLHWGDCFVWWCFYSGKQSEEHCHSSRANLQ